MDDKDEEILQMFKKVQINIPLLNAVQQVLRYANFLKELYTNKRKVVVSKNVFCFTEEKHARKML